MEKKKVATPVVYIDVGELRDAMEDKSIDTSAYIKPPHVAFTTYGVFKLIGYVQVQEQTSYSLVPVDAEVKSRLNKSFERKELT